MHRAHSPSPKTRVYFHKHQTPVFLAFTQELKCYGACKRKGIQYPTAPFFDFHITKRLGHRDLPSRHLYSPTGNDTYYFTGRCHITIDRKFLPLPYIFLKKPFRSFTLSHTPHLVTVNHTDTLRRGIRTALDAYRACDAAGRNALLRAVLEAVIYRKAKRSSPAAFELECIPRSG